MNDKERNFIDFSIKCIDMHKTDDQQSKRLKKYYMSIYFREVILPSEIQLNEKSVYCIALNLRIFESRIYLFFLFVFILAMPSKGR